MKKIVPTLLVLLIASAAPVLHAQEKHAGFDPEKLAELIRNQAKEGNLAMDLEGLKQLLIKAGMPKAKVNDLSRAELLELLMKSAGLDHPFGQAPLDVPDDPDFDPEKFSELLMNEAREGGGHLEMDLNKFRDWLVRSGMKKDKVKKMSGGELMGFLMKHMQNLGLPFGGMPNQLALPNEAMEQLDTQFDALLEGHRPALKEAYKSTVLFFKGDEFPLVLGTVIDARGLVLSKASEIRKGGTQLTCMLGQDPEKKVKGKLLHEWKDHDLALVKIEAKGLKPISWYRGELPDIGAFITSPGPGSDDPLGIGLLSVVNRSLSHKDRGFLGIGVGVADRGVRVTQVFESSPAAKAGLETDDIILTINGKAPESVPAFIETVGSIKPNQQVRLKVTRGNEEKNIKVKLAERPKERRNTSSRIEQMQRMGGALSDVRDGFPEAFQHDMPLDPRMMGGPVVDLHGRVLGLNIARASRIKTYALPAIEMLELLKEVDLNQLVSADAPGNEPGPAPKPNPEDQELARLKKAANAAQQKAARARKAFESAKRAAEEAAKELEAYQAKP